MEITFWGVRGSYPVPGPATVRYGGQTSCVEVRAASGACLILDAGTGLRGLGQKLAREAAGAPRSYHALLSHVHWDHIQGLPFFEPAYVPGTRIHVYALLTAADELHQVIGGITRHEFFPVPLEAVPATFEFTEVDPGVPLTIGEFTVLPIALNHPFGSVGYKVTADGTSIAYVSDTAPFGEILHKQHFVAGLEDLTDGDRAALAEMRGRLVDAVRGCDTVVYDTHFLPEEYAKFPHYGHSTPDHALDIVAGQDVRQLVLYHHAPGHSDDVMDQVAATYGERGAALGVEVVTAREGMALPIGRGDPGVKVRFWGVRGSFAMSGADFLRYGGNTTCVEICAADGRRLVIDLGTGATELGKHLMAREFGAGKGSLSILLSHTHLDHIQGLPFFTPFFVEGNRIRIRGADPASLGLESTLQNQLAPHYSPLGGLENLSADVDIETFTPGAHLSFDGFEVATAAVPHGNMWTTAFRITNDGKTIAFLSDVEYPAPDQPTGEAMELARGADLLIHDAMHADHEYALRKGWGHSPVAAGVHLAHAAGVAKLVLFHHSPDATDAMIDAIVATAQRRSKVPVFAASEGHVLDV